MPTNALAFSYLGLALHQAGQPAEAERAYLRALSIDHDLTEVHYDLGCLWMDQSTKLEQAKSELTTYTLGRPNSADGWLKLGQVQSRLRELTAADRSLEEALRLDPHNAEALTSLGSVRYQRRRTNEAAQLFARALKEQPTYGPALLNSAILAQQELNDPRLALQRYREYAALQPPPENLKSVQVLIQQLEQQLNPPPPHEAINTNVAVQPASATNLARVVPAEPPHSPALPKPAPPTNATHITQQVSRSEPPTNLTKAPAPPAVVRAPPPAPTNTGISENVPVVHLAADPVIKPAEDNVSVSQPEHSSTQQSSSTSTSNLVGSDEAKSQKRGFFQRINPINLFGHDGKSSNSSAPSGTLVASPSATGNGGGPTGGIPVTNDLRKFPRYSYLRPAKPLPGDRGLAEQPFAEGVRLQQARRFGEAAQAYRRAIQLDPTYYDAQYNLGLAAAANGDLSQASAAYERALAIAPDSLDARYNFGLVLKQSGYVLDAVTQFEELLARNTNDARAHLALGNIYAQQLSDVAKAREHYQAVLALAPQSPQAGAIRYWLTDHPR